MTALRRLSGDGFRVFFLAAGPFAMLWLAVWVGSLAVQAAGGIPEVPSAVPPHLFIAAVAGLWLAGLGIGSEVAALHLLGIGGVGGLTVAVMSRAILGHSGRALRAPGPVALAFALFTAALWLAMTGPRAPCRAKAEATP